MKRVWNCLRTLRKTFLVFEAPRHSAGYVDHCVHTKFKGLAHMHARGNNVLRPCTKVALTFVRAIQYCQRFVVNSGEGSMTSRGSEQRPKSKEKQDYRLTERGFESDVNKRPLNSEKKTTR